MTIARLYRVFDTDERLIQGNQPFIGKKATAADPNAGLANLET
jgi:hypothetical protein